MIVNDCDDRLVVTVTLHELDNTAQQNVRFYTADKAQWLQLTRVDMTAKTGTALAGGMVIVQVVTHGGTIYTINWPAGSSTTHDDFSTNNNSVVWYKSMLLNEVDVSSSANMFEQLSPPIWVQLKDGDALYLSGIGLETATAEFYWTSTWCVYV